jgi:hypothetical protein
MAKLRMQSTSFYIIYYIERNVLDYLVYLKKAWKLVLLTYNYYYIRKLGY